MTDYDSVVIGAGNGGLTAALGLARAGVKTLLLERHNIPGGCATSFVRGRFEFEVALHQLSGLGTESFPGPLRDMLARLEILDRLEFVQMPNLYRMVVPGRLDWNLYRCPTFIAWWYPADWTSPSRLTGLQPWAP